MMQFEELWQIVKKRNKQLAKGKVTMSTANFKKALKMSYEQGEKRQRDLNKNMDMFSSMFGGMFGGRR